MTSNEIPLLSYCSNSDEKEDLKSKYSEMEIRNMEKNILGIHNYSISEEYPLSRIQGELKLPFPDKIQKIVDQFVTGNGSSESVKQTIGAHNVESVQSVPHKIKLRRNIQYVGDSFTQECFSCGSNIPSEF